MIALVLGGCAHTLGIPSVSYTAKPEPLPLVRTAVDPRWYIPILVEDHGLWAFFIDTGYSYSTCDDGLIEALGLETKGKTVVRGELGRLTTTKTELPQVMLGGHVLEGLVCQVRDLDRTSSIRDSDEVPIAGVLGMDVLRPFFVRMDPEQGELHLLAPEGVGVSKDEPNAVKLRREHGFGIRTLVPIRVGDETVWPVLDTGATSTHLDGGKIGLEPTRVREDVVVRGTGGSGTALRTIAYYEVLDLTLAGASPGMVVIAGREGGVGAGLLGLNVLSRYVASYDFRTGYARFEPVTPRRLPTWSEWRSAERPPESTRISAPLPPP
ncbi:MAG: aspartyl protease family protein [Myxococcota bacterium]